MLYATKKPVGKKNPLLFPILKVTLEEFERKKKEFPVIKGLPYIYTKHADGTIETLPECAEGWTIVVR